MITNGVTNIDYVSADDRFNKALNNDECCYFYNDREKYNLEKVRDCTEEYKKAGCFMPPTVSKVFLCKSKVGFIFAVAE